MISLPVDLNSLKDGKDSRIEILFQKLQTEIQNIVLLIRREGFSRFRLEFELFEIIYLQLLNYP